VATAVTPTTTLYTATPAATFADFFTALTTLTGASPSPLATAFVAALGGAAAPAAYAWECPPVTAATAPSSAARFVLVASAALARPRADAAAFASHLADAPRGGAAVFANLGGDAVLVAPSVPPPAGSGGGGDDDGGGGGGGGGDGAVGAYGHLGAFVRGAPPAAVAALWAAVGDAVASRLEGNGGRPLWVSTAGLGVPWLHVRLGDAPKYYRHAAFRAPPPVARGGRGAAGRGGRA